MVRCFLISINLPLTQIISKKSWRLITPYWGHHKISIYHKVAKRNMCYSSWNYLKGVLQIKFSEVACDLVGNFTLNIPWFTKNNIIDRCLDFQSGLLYLFSFSTKLFSISWFKNSYHTWLKKHLLHCFPVLWKIWKHH